MTPTEKRQRLRAILAGPKMIAPATVFDALSARVAENVGYEVGVLSGSVSGNTVLGAPDLMLQTLTEFAAQVRAITRASNLSLVLDADNGYGNALNAMRCVEELEHAGTSALMIEDVVMPQRFGASSVEIVSTQEHVGKLRAALSARRDPALIVIARTAALRAEDPQSVAARARAYEATGVDALFLSGLKSVEAFDVIRAAVKLPIVLGSAQVKREDMQARCVRLMLQGHQPVAAVVKTLHDVYQHLYSGGTPSDLKSKLATPDELAAATRAPQYEAWSKQFLN